MIIINKIIHYSKLLEFSRNDEYSKVVIKPHSNRTLKNNEVVSCSIHLNIYKDPKDFIQIQSGIKAALINASTNEDLPQNEREVASGFTAHYVCGDMVWLSVSKWKKMLEFEKRNNLNLNIPLKIKNFIENYYTLKTT